MKIISFLMILALLFFSTGCEEFREALEDGGGNYDDPTSENFRPRFVVGIFSIVEYPRASDLEKVKPAIETLDELGIESVVRILSAHRTPKETAEFASSARENGIAAIICAAGKAAHLAGAVAAQTTLPVIGIPVKSSTLDGLDALLSTVQMPSGMPVATVAIDGAVNAALLAAQIIAVTEPAMAQKLEAKREKAKNAILSHEMNIM